VVPLSDAERRALYLRARIGIDMHVSNVPSETGNMRMYEVPAHGAMLLCDKAALNAHALIFKPDVEAVFYDDLQDAIDKIEYYVAHPAERIAIARAGFERRRSDYDYEGVLKGLLDWASAIR
jgi:spore maturation protein CgeB